jgi:CheY-like chemotaxis protein
VDNGAAALEALRGVKARLLILDVSLPGISGLELHDWLQADEATRGISVVFVTADTEALRQLEERRMPHVLAKPFDLDELLGLVETALTAEP